MKTPEQMAEEYVAHNRSYPYDPFNAQDRYMRNSYLVGYEACAKDIHWHWKEEWKDLYKRIEESSLPAMDAMEGRYLYKVKELKAAIPCWISVKDRLPEDGDDLSIMLVWRNIEHDYDTVRWRYQQGWDCVIQDKSTITHWMPLPAAPKE